jgi:membrane-bound lytic murein transglycosylase B
MTSMMMFLSALVGVLTFSASWIQNPIGTLQQMPATPALSIGLFMTDSTMSLDSMLAVARIDTVTPAAGSSFTIEKMPGLDPRFVPVVKRLVHDGFAEDWVASHFTDKRTVFIPKMTVVKVPSGKAFNERAAYAWVNTKESADACRAFIDKYAQVMQQAEERYGVDKEMIAALMRCETRHGTVTGDYHVFSVYASMALMDQPPFISSSVQNAKEVMGDRKASDSETKSMMTWIRNRAASRSKWAYKELTNLLKIDQSGHADALSIYGSWAGAFGWSQFLPSSYLSRAVDGDGDQKIDLFTAPDAICSVANYLSKAGYKIGDHASQRRAIFSYNNSSAYVESIMGLADRLR